MASSPLNPNPAYGGVIAFNPQGAQPPVPTYVTASDSLALTAFTPIANVTVRIDWRMLLPTGEVKTNEFTLIPTNDRAAHTITMPLVEGFLLTARVNAASSSAANRCWVRLQLNTGTAGASTVFTLCQGYVTTQSLVAWPPGMWPNSSDGSGAIVSVTGTLPGAGVEIAETVPSHALWELLSFRYGLTTSATAATRQSDLIMDDGTNVFMEHAPISSQAASLTQTYNWGRGAGPQAVANSIVTVPLSHGMVLPAGFRIRTNTFNLQAGDQYTAPQYLVREWAFN